MSSTIFKNASSSVIQTIVSALLLFFLYRFLLQSLGADQLGVWAVVLASTSVARLSDMGLSGAALKFVAKSLAAGKSEDAAHVVQTASISIGAVLAILLIAVYPLLQSTLTLIIPPHSIILALSILPWALLSLWFGLIAGIFNSALDGCNRMDIRNIILSVCNIIYLVGAFWLVPIYGLEGLAKGQLGQTVIMVILSWVAIRKQLPSLPWVPYSWKKDKFKEIFSYAINFQISGLAAMLFDPAIKFMLTKFGGLSEVAFYEMANQVIAKARGVLISAFRSVVPAIAYIDDADHERLISIYLKSYRILSFIAVPYFVGIIVALPLISILWIGHIEVNFISFGYLLSLGWMLSTVGIPAYFHNIGTGKLAWNTASQLLSTGILLPLAFILGGLYSGFAVVASAMFSAVLPNLLLALIVQKRMGVSFNKVLPLEQYKLFLFVTLTVFIIGALNYYNFNLINSIGFNTVSLTAYITVTITAFWLHPYKKSLFSGLKKPRGGEND